MQKLNLPEYEFRIRQQNGKQQVFDFIRKKYVALTPEEWVRQHLVSFLVHHQKYAPGLIAIEMPVKVNELQQRADIVVYDRKGRPVMIVECKAPSVKLTKAVFDQAARYNMQLNVKFLLVSNGLQHYCAHIDSGSGNYQMLKQIPGADQLFIDKV